MKLLQIIFFLAIAISPAMSQSNFGIELKSSRNITYNAGSLLGYHGGTEITKENNPTTTSYSIGLYGNIGSRGKVRIHVGKHFNGRVFDFIHHNDLFGSQPDYSFNVDIPYEFFQVTPSFSYNILNSKLKVPIEVGIAVNQRYRDGLFLDKNRKYNSDLRLSTGVGYQFFDKLTLSGNFVYSCALSDYQEEDDFGSYKPYQVGGEVSLSYSFGKMDKD